MPSFRTAVVVEVLEERRGLQRIRVRGVEGERAFCLTELTGPVAEGDRVLLNTTGVELGLGTGGWHVVHWNLERQEWHHDGPGHVMKLRYTGLQADTGAGELDHGSVPDTLDGTPVVACLVHSQVGAVATAIQHLRPGTRVAVVVTDGGALPLAISDMVNALKDHDIISVTLTAGQTFGGDIEAVSVPSALLMARHVAGAEVVVAGMGPGLVGTGTTFGNTACDAAWVIDASDALGGRPVLCVRASEGDARARHRGVSHHTLSVLRLAHARPFVASVPLPLDGSLCRVVEVDQPDPDVALAPMARHITHMGRGIDEDHLFFSAATAAAAVAVRLCEGHGGGGEAPS